MGSGRIEVRGVEKLYRRMAPGAHLSTLKSALLSRSLTGGLRAEDVIAALKGLDFEVGPGEAFGVIGGNGSGKSTLLKILSGILKPTAGTVRVEGRVAALIELGAGFHPEISGRENVFINGALLGLSRAEIEERYDSIVEFSGLADFMEEPVKNYSSGMYVRLGFAVAIHTSPEVLLVDEVLAVGDEAFAHRCIRRLEEMLSAGCTVLLVSHSLDLVERLCDRVLWIDSGEQRLLGEPRRVVDAYRQAVAEAEGRSHQREKEKLEEEHEEEVLRWGSREAVIHAVRLKDSRGEETYCVESGAAVIFEMDVEAVRPLTDFVFGIGISTPRGTDCWGTNTEIEGFVPQRLEGRVTVSVPCPALRLAPGEYLVDAAVHARDGAPYDYRRKVVAFTVTAENQSRGIYLPEHSWQFEGEVRWRPRGEDTQGTARRAPTPLR